MNDAVTADDVRGYLGRDLDDLYALLVPPADKELYSRGGLIARGQSIVRARAEAIRRVVCPQRAANLDSVDLGVLIATSLAADPALGRLPALPLAAVLLKVGLDSFCDSGDPDGLV
jgi:hypothetical protein